MGAQHTKGEISVGHLTPEECSVLKKVFNRISSTAAEKNSGPGCSYRSFQMHCESHLDDWLARKISDKLATKNIKTNELQIPLQNFLNFVSSTLKGSFEDKFEIIWSLAVETPTDETKTILAGEILQYTRSIIESYIKCTESLPSSRSWAHAPHMTSDSVTDLAYHILLDLFHNGVAPKDIIATPEVILHSRKHASTQPSSYSMEQVLTAFSKSVLFLNLQNSIISHCFDFELSTYFNPALIPHCFKPLGIDADNITLLDYPRLIYLNSQLAPELRKQWRFLFSTASHGESFSKFLESIQDKGHTLIIVRDTGGNVFGGYAPQSWKIGPKFFGSEQSFLFHLSPRFVTYSTTGYNKNFLYLNVQQKTFPNGLGFGGTLEYFGLWLDSEFGKGKCSPSCSTYTNPQLSSSPEFDVEHLEVWALGPEPKNENDDEDERTPGKSILDKDLEARAMLDIIGKRAHSDGYRDIPKE